jgi:hypothetical protein
VSENSLLQFDQKSATISPNDVAAPHIVEHVQITRAEWLLVQQIRAVRKQSLAFVDIGGDGVPKRVRIFEACAVNL